MKKKPSSKAKVTRASEPPRYRQRRKQGRDQMFIILSNQRIYCGPWDDPRTEERYYQEVSDWYARGKTRKPEDNDAGAGATVTVQQCADAFLAYCKDYYRNSPATSYDRVRQAMRDLTDMWGGIPISELTGLHVRSVREAQVNKRKKCDPDKPAMGLYTVNYRIKTVKRMVAYAVSMNLCPPDVKIKVDSVENLVQGRCAAPPPKKVTPVPEADIRRTRKHLNRSLQALIDLQLASGCRAGELVGLRRRDIIMVSNDLWEAHPMQHKTAYRGRKRVLMFGPESIKVLRPFVMRCKQDECLFPTSESMTARIENAHCHRRPNQAKNTPKTARTLNEHYSVASYRKAIHRVCHEHDIPLWSPHRLRHNYASNTERKAKAVEPVRLLLGHANTNTTQQYIEQELDDARVLARQYS